MKPRRYLLIGISLLPLSACERGVPPPNGVSVGDSAGISVVVNYSPAWREGEAWTVDEEPLVSIGTVNGPEGYLLSDVRGVARLPDGRIVIANGATAELRFFDSGGSYLYSAGGRGEGPGEFRNLHFLTMFGGDSLLVYEGFPNRFSVFDQTGAFVRSSTPPQTAGTSFLDKQWAGFLDERRIVVYSLAAYQLGLLKQGVDRLLIPFGSFDLAGESLDSLGYFRDIEFISAEWAGRTSFIRRPFGRYTRLLARGNLIYLASNDDYTIHVLDSTGSPVRIVRVDRAPRKVRADDLDRYVASILVPYASEPGGQVGRLEEQIRAASIPETMPAFRSLEVDQMGNLWVEEYRVPGEDGSAFSVFSPGGRLLGTVEFPRSLARGPVLSNDAPLEIGPDFVLGVWRTEYDIEQVRMYRLNKPRDQGPSKR